LAEIIDPAKISGDTVKFAATVKVVDCDTDHEFIYQIVGDEESDIETGKLAVSSPVARALIGKKVGASAEVHTPKGAKEYEILEIAYK
jgi:transcription elongation factor GreA